MILEERTDAVDGRRMFHVKWVGYTATTWEPARTEEGGHGLPPQMISVWDARRVPQKPLYVCELPPIHTGRGSRSRPTVNLYDTELACMLRADPVRRL